MSDFRIFVLFKRIFWFEKKQEPRTVQKPQPLLRFCGTTDLIFFLRYFYSAANWKNGRSRYAPAASGSLEKKFVFIYFFLFLIGGHWTGSFHGRRDKAVVFVLALLCYFSLLKETCASSLRVQSPAGRTLLLHWYRCICCELLWRHALLFWTNSFLVCQVPWRANVAVTG